MMMVDTINPSTSEPDQFAPAANSAAETPITDTPPTSDRFYGGFDRPDDVKVNLAAAPGQETGFASAIPAEPVKEQAAPVQNMNMIADVSPAAAQPLAPNEAQVHSSYTKNTPINLRGILVIVGIGLVATLVFSLGTFFIIGAGNADKISKEQAQLDTLNKKLASLSATPDALQLPTTTTDNSASTSTSTVTTTPDTTQTIQSTTTTTPAATTDTSGDTDKQAAG